MNQLQNLFDAQKTYFASNVTRSHAWRVEQLERMGRMIKENESALQRAIARDFKTASQEYIFETQASYLETEYQKSQLKTWMAPVEAPVPAALAKTGHKGVGYRDPFGVTLIMGPFNGPLLLLLRPAITALAAGNTCVLKLSAALSATNAVLLELVPKYFDPRAVTAVAGNREATTELLKLPFDFIFFTGSTKVGKVVAHAAAENLTPVLLELGGQNPALVDSTANIKDAAKKIAWGAMAWAMVYVSRLRLCARVDCRGIRRRGKGRTHRALRQGPEIEPRLFAHHQFERSQPPRRPDRSGQGGHRWPIRSRGPLPRPHDRLSGLME
jgi:aldehyde dehydrogenase (NAD+)